MKIFKQTLKRLPAEITRDASRDALRQALQSALAAATIFLIMKAFNLPETFLAVLSAVLVVDRSIGNTMSNAKGRVLATVVGSAIGFVFVSFIPFGYGTVVSLMVTMFVMNAIASFKPSWRYGVVAAVAISLGAESDALQISLDRLIAIGIGISVGLLVTAIVWPEKASTRAKKHLRKALNNACDRFKISLHNIQSEDKDEADSIANDFYSNLGNTKEAAKTIKFGDQGHIKELIDATEKLYNSILILHRVEDSTETTLLDEGDESMKNASELNDQTCDIISSLINKNHVVDQKFKDMAALIERIKGNVLSHDDSKNQIYRYTFVFAIEEIYESLDILQDLVNAD